jgi:4-amino-4-deoxy-L-arabinose transferase-like glycosyltransferase
MFIRKSHITILVILVLLLGISNFIWLSLNQIPPLDDDGFHIARCIKILNIITNSPLFDSSRITFDNNLYPPLFHFIAAICAFVFGKSIIVLIMSNLIFVCLAFFSLYLIGLKLGDGRIGLLASFLLLSYPVFFYLSRCFLLEIAVCSIVIASIAALMYSEGFRKAIPSAIFGLFLGLGMLTKQYYAVFIAGPAVFLLFDSLLKESSKKRVFLNFIFALSLGVAIAALWYVPNFSKMLPLLISAASDPSLAPFDLSVFSFENLFFYFNLIFNEQILLFFFLTFIFSAFIYFRRIERKYLFLLLSWLIIPYIVFTLFLNKYFYYTQSYLPAIALITAYGLLNIQRAFFRRIVILFVVCVGLFQFIVLSYFNLKQNKLTLSLRNPYVRILPINLSSIQAKKEYYPQSERQGRDVMEKIAAKINHSCPGKIVKILIIELDANYLSRRNIKIRDNFEVANYGGFKGYSYLVGARFDIFGINFSNMKIIEDQFDFIISPEKLENIEIYSSKKGDYALFNSFVMRDGSEVYLYMATVKQIL